MLPDAIAVHGDLAGRGVAYKELPAVGLDVDGRACHACSVAGDSLAIREGLDDAGVVAVLSADALSDLVQDAQSTMGLAMTARVKITAGNITDWIGWEPALRALLDGRKVHETGDVTFVDLDGGELDLDRTFTLDDDREEMAHFLEQAGFLHVRERVRRERDGRASAPTSTSGSRRRRPTTASRGGPPTSTASTRRCASCSSTRSRPRCATLVERRPLPLDR